MPTTGLDKTIFTQCEYVFNVFNSILIKLKGLHNETSVDKFSLELLRKPLYFTKYMNQTDYILPSHKASKRFLSSSEEFKRVSTSALVFSTISSLISLK